MTQIWSLATKTPGSLWHCASAVDPDTGMPPRKVPRRETAAASIASSLGVLARLPAELRIMIMQQLHICTIRSRMTLVSHNVRGHAMSSEALDFCADIKFLSNGRKSPITPVLKAFVNFTTRIHARTVSQRPDRPIPRHAARSPDSPPNPAMTTSAHLRVCPRQNLASRLGRLNVDGRITHVKLGNHSWGKTTTKQLLKLFPQLKSLDVGMSKKVHINDFNDLALPVAPRLAEFKMGWSYSATCASIINLVCGRGALLKVLALERLEGMGDGKGIIINDTVLQELARSSPNLRVLKLSGALAVSDAGIASLVAGCSDLMHLHLELSMIFTPFLGHPAKTHPCFHELTQASVTHLSESPWIRSVQLIGFPGLGATVLSAGWLRPREDSETP